MAFCREGGATPWRTFVQAHWPALVAADFFTTEVWTTRGLVTYYTAFLIEWQSRRVQVLGSTPYPDEAFVIQCLRSVSSESDALLQRGKILVCDRDPKWSKAVEQWLSTAGARVVRTPRGAPNCNAHAERFVRSVKEECLDRVVPLGSGTFVERCESSSLTTIVNETTKALRTNWSTVRLYDEAVPCVVASESAEFSATTTGRPRKPEARSYVGTERGWRSCL